jgi:predicted RNase H-like nuclease (RuvC/YqgF family)
VLLLAAATLATAAAVTRQSVQWLSVATAVTVVCSWVAARILYRELAQSRREANADRAAQANAYRLVFDRRADEHAVFTAAMTDRLEARAREVRQLEASVLSAEKRAMAAETRVSREARRADAETARSRELTVRVEELERARDELEAARAQLGEQLAALREAWRTAPLTEMDGEIEAVVDLLAWEERVAAAHRPVPEQKQA